MFILEENKIAQYQQNNFLPGEIFNKTVSDVYPNYKFPFREHHLHTRGVNNMIRLPLAGS